MPVQSHTVGPCSLSQVVTAETLRGWGEPGLDAHLRGVQREYAQRAACIWAVCEQVRAALCCTVGVRGQLPHVAGKLVGLLLK